MWQNFAKKNIIVIFGGFYEGGKGGKVGFTRGVVEEVAKER